MNRKKAGKIFVLSVVITALSISYCIAGVSNRIVAIVNDEMITLHELKKRIKEMTGFEPDELRLRDIGKYIETRRQILELMINDRITQGKIKELGINTTPEQVDAAIEKVRKDNQWTHEDLMAKLNSDGITYEKYREGLKRDIERISLINYEVKSKIIIRDEQISRYYNKHKGKFSGKEKVHIAAIFLRRKNNNDDEIHELSLKGEEILERLKKGEDFSELTREYSEGPAADKGGDLGIFQTDQLDPELRKILQDMQEGGFSNLIILPKGIQIIRLIKREEARVKTLEEIRDAIYSTLFWEEVNRRYVSWIEELRKRSYTQIIY